MNITIFQTTKMEVNATVIEILITMKNLISCAYSLTGLLVWKLSRLETVISVQLMINWSELTLIQIYRFAQNLSFFKIGSCLQELFILHYQYNCTMTAYITAWNPLGNTLTDFENERRK